MDNIFLVFFFYRGMDTVSDEWIQGLHAEKGRLIMYYLRHLLIHFIA